MPNKTYRKQTPITLISNEWIIIIIYHTNSGLHIYAVGDDDGDDGDDDEDLFLSLASKFPHFSFSSFGSPYVSNPNHPVLSEFLKIKFKFCHKSLLPIV